MVHLLISYPTLYPTYFIYVKVKSGILIEHGKLKMLKFQGVLGDRCK